jgi:hypothetical protein
MRDSIEVSVNPERAAFRCEERLAGLYRLDDPFKPHFTVLNTPAGHNTVCVSPGDHRHHKGLMFALRCADLNFWEEDPESGACGIQKVLATETVPGGIRQELLWRRRGGGLETYRETRLITCASEDTAFRWTWRTRRAALREHCLIKSPWSLQLPDGRCLNYHGLGIRLPWMWCWGGPLDGSVEIDGVPANPRQAAGCKARSVGFHGLIDGQWEPTKAAVTLSRDRDYAWFVLREGFPYLSVGPSVLEEVTVREGETIEETYTVIVEDR